MRSQKGLTSRNPREGRLTSVIRYSKLAKPQAKSYRRNIANPETALTLRLGEAIVNVRRRRVF